MIERRALLGLIGAGGVSALLFGRATRSLAAPSFAVTRTEQDWRKMLGAQRFAVLRHAATEWPYSSPLLKEHRKGIFVCAGCELPLFGSATKFESGTGWPSFWKPIPKAIVTRPDRSGGMSRTEVLCARCGGHLGHVFDDGPRPTGLRYCMNGLALNFRAA